MPTGEPPDPVRAALVAILQQLNRAESVHEGRARDQSLELPDLERILRGFWAVEQRQVKIPLALGLLVRNGLVEVEAVGNYPTKGRAPPRARYRITAAGKGFLIEAQGKTDRIP